MQTMKRKGLFVLMAIALSLVTAQSAAAGWYDKGTGLPSGTNPSIQLTGTFDFTSATGGVDCPAITATLQMTGGGTDGHLSSLSPETLLGCEVTGVLVFLAGGSTTVSSINLTTAGTAVSTGEEDIRISGLTIDYRFTNGFKLTLSPVEESPLVATPDDPEAMTKATLSGPMSSALGNVTVNGSMNVVGGNAGTYGVAG